MLNRARVQLEHGVSSDDPAWLYWVTEGEIEMIAGSCALDLGDPKEALRRFDAAMAADYRGDDEYPRSHAIYLARAAEAHLMLRDLDGTLHRASHAMQCLGGVDSTRSSTTLTSLRAKLASHASNRAVREFLDSTR
ncbi:hypothetical protein GCM10009681_27980 [Luedemannella helvata]|uniref:Uncharacterized protein n=1 Tax=Luedemannella helvata TaxID=349315 RepID=A0ABP4WNM4_9ACTN